MAKILAPIKGYNGVSASVRFMQGVGFTDDPYLIKWLTDHGYEVIEEEVIEAPADAEEIPIGAVGIGSMEVEVSAEVIDVNEATGEVQLDIKIADPKAKKKTVKVAA